MIPDYIKALETEIRKRSVKQCQINTIYFGGGTPSLLPVKEVELLLHIIKDSFAVLPDAEITFEINPGSVDLNYLENLRDIGINRISIGVQSFNDAKLEFLKRIHTAGQAVKAIENAKKAGFSNISLDLIYGLPFETGAIWMKDIEQAVKMQPDHLSCYMLTIEPLTPLDKIVKQGLTDPLDNQFMASLFKKTAQVLNQFQYEHYEISSFAKGRAYRSKHNSQYWDMTPYFGFGAAAHSFDGNKRAWNHRSIKQYIKDMKSDRLPVEDFETLSLEQKKLETIMLGLRTFEGVDINKYKSQFNIGFQEEFSEIIEAVQGQSYGLLGAESFALNIDGKICLDDIIETFARHIVT